MDDESRPTGVANQPSTQAGNQSQQSAHGQNTKNMDDIIPSQIYNYNKLLDNKLLDEQSFMINSHK